MKIRRITSRKPGIYYKRRIVYKGRWVKWVGFAALPIHRRPRRWVGLAIETQTTPPQGKVTDYKRHELDSGHRYPMGYDPITREPLDE